ncbi:MAG: TIM-barrel domain-containing protein [bacterium]
MSTPKTAMILTVALTLMVGSAMAQRSVICDPVANPDAMVVTGNTRFTVLTPAMIRMEWSPSATFEDRASLTFVNRRLPVPTVSTRRFQGWLILETDELELRYKENGGPFAPENLAVRIKSLDSTGVWRPGMPDTANLGGTVRTLDQVNGRSPLDPGLISRDGWVLVDDSRNLLYGTDSLHWATPRPDSLALDWVFMGYGHDYPRALRDYTTVAGRIPLPPKFAFGAWWSRYWAYTDRELEELVTDYHKHNVPLDVLVVDMDWHMEGWTGYTWNPKYFPDPEGFLRWMHERGLKVTLNLHPHSGVQSYEVAYLEFARAMGVDPATKQRIPFDIASPRYMKNYFELLHRPLERQGVDFWWIDWQQGEESAIPGLDPLFWLNDQHWEEMTHDLQRPHTRPLIFSRWGGFGSHRYQIGFSGDTRSTWATLKFQPEFTATAANVAFPFWSHDIGGHLPGTVNPEIYARWIQYAVFNPILRTHATKNAKAERRIWAFDDEIFNSTLMFFHLRYELLPYIYTTARAAYDDATPLVRPLYWQWPELEGAYDHGDEYLFGSQLLVAPVAVPRDTVSRTAVRDVWFPPGRWTHLFTGRVYEGPDTVRVASTLNDLPVFARSGAIIPMKEFNERSDAPLDPLVVRVYPGESGSFNLYEDDGSTDHYLEGQFTRTPISMQTVDNVCTVSVGPAEGSYSGMLEARAIRIELKQMWPAGQVSFDGTAIPRVASRDEAGDRAAWWYEPEDFSVVVRVPSRSVHEAAAISVSLSDADPASLRSGLQGRCMLLEDLAGRMGDQIPDLLRDVLESRKNFGAGGNNDPAGLVRAVNGGWNDILTAITSSDAPEAVRREAMLRMLGLSVSVSLDAAEGGLYSANVVVDALEPIRDLGVVVKCTDPGGWKAVSRDQSGDLKVVGKPWRFSITYQPPESMVPGQFLANVTLTTPHGEVSVPWSTEVLPSIPIWHVLGPFPIREWKTALDEKQKPEKVLKKPRLNKTYRGIDRQRINWTLAERKAAPGIDPDAEFVVDLQKQFGGEIKRAVGYAVSYIESPREMNARFDFGTDDGYVVWLNGQELARRQVGRPYTPREDSLPITLKQGTNVLMLKISQWGGGWEFAGHLLTPDGKPLHDVRILTQP